MHATFPATLSPGSRVLGTNRLGVQPHCTIPTTVLTHALPVAQRPCQHVQHLAGARIPNSNHGFCTSHKGYHQPTQALGRGAALAHCVPVASPE